MKKTCKNRNTWLTIGTCLGVGMTFGLLPGAFSDGTIEQAYSQDEK